LFFARFGWLFGLAFEATHKAEIIVTSATCVNRLALREYSCRLVFERVSALDCAPKIGAKKPSPSPPPRVVRGNGASEGNEAHRFSKEKRGREKRPVRDVQVLRQRHSISPEYSPQAKI
jgi:hypothetical protein